MGPDALGNQNKANHFGNFRANNATTYIISVIDVFSIIRFISVFAVRVCICISLLHVIENRFKALPLFVACFQCDI